MKKLIFALGLVAITSVTFFYKLVLSHSFAMHRKSQEKEFVIVIPSYNNKEWYKKNLDSVLYQNYSNYKVIYADDCSPDGTGDLVEAYAQEKINNGSLILIKNKTRKLALGNIYDAIQMISSEAIVLIVDGDDWLAHNNVLSYLNTLYANDDVWLTYGQYRMFPGNAKGICCQIPSEVIAQNNFRNYRWVSSHLRTFYAALFHKIEKKDLLYDGEFLTMTGDQAIMFPMLEMAGFHAKFVSEVLYIYNIVNPISDWRVNSKLQHSIERHIRSSQKYQKLASLF